MSGGQERSDGSTGETPACDTSADRLLVGVPTSAGVGVGPVAHRSEGSSPGPGAAVLVTSDLTPADVAGLDSEVVAGIAAAAGAPLSHAAILARSRGIPTVTGLGPPILEVAPGTVVLVDGDAGTVQVEPPSEAVEAAEARRRTRQREQDEDRRLAAAPAVTRDGSAVAVLANVGSPDDARAAIADGADGVGMLRTEFAFLNRDESPDEEEQYQAYRRIAEAIGDRPLILRTLDLGADIPAWGGAQEPNPALGNRGLRFTLSSPDLFESQLRAVVRLATERPLRVMFPMVTSVEELRRARACLDEVAGAQAGATPAHALEVGITVEVPAAALTAEVFARAVDFFAIGTNDLTQYTLAADRSNAAVAPIADGLEPAVLRLIREVTSAAERHGREVVVVGELGSDRLGVPLLLGLGVTTLSVRPNAVAAVKQLVRSVSMDEARGLAEAALGAESSRAVRELASQYWSDDPERRRRSPT